MNKIVNALALLATGKLLDPNEEFVTHFEVFNCRFTSAAVYNPPLETTNLEGAVEDYCKILLNNLDGDSSLGWSIINVHSLRVVIRINEKDGSVSGAINWKFRDIDDDYIMDCLELINWDHDNA
jgi:hypothetical protein